MQFKYTLHLILLLQIARFPLAAQPFFFGADLSYVNELEDCGVVYKENQTPKDPYQIFADHHCNLVRLRLWHTPSWYDALNSGKRYADLADVKKSIARAHAKGMQVLLDFHLSDNWADPAKQRVPSAWLPVVNNLPVLQDSLKNYITNTLLDLAALNLLPEMVQIGNETNKGILLSPQDDTNGWVLNWPRNAALFNTAIQAVRNVESQTGKPIKIALHIAGPGNADWLAKAFHDNGVSDFDVIGLSYYWAWHKPTTIASTGDIIAGLRQKYPDKQVMIFETGYIWTTGYNDNANNTITVSNPAYLPVTPQNQKKWLIDLTQEVINRGGSGVLYWAWHKPTTIANTGDIIAGLRQKYPDKQVMILETGYIWTTAYNDAANNVIDVTHPAYQPVTPQNQKKWLIDLTQEVINRGGSGVLYWEPAWVSSTCRTQWGQGSHQENAAFFDFNTNLLTDGGIGFMTHTYANLTAAPEPPAFQYLRILPNNESLTIQCAPLDPAKSVHILVSDVTGKILMQKTANTGGQTTLDTRVEWPGRSAGIYVVKVWQEGGVSGSRKVW